MTNVIDRTQAVILSGGGAYGAYEVGVMKALFMGESPATSYQPLNPGIFTGTSVGGVNASVLVSYPDISICSLIAFLESIWVDQISESPRTCGNGVFRFRGDLFRYLDARCLLSNPAQSFTEIADDSSFLARDWFRRGISFLMSGSELENRTAQLFDFSSFVSAEPFKALLRRTVSPEGIRRSDRVLKVIATNWETGELKVFGNADMTDEVGHDVVLGSAAIPGFFAPHYVAGRPYVDGGLLMNTPLQCAIQAGGQTLHVIYMDPDVRNIPLSKLRSTIETLDRVILITSASKINEDIDTAAWVNEGLEVMERALRGEPLFSTDVPAFIRVAAQIERHMREEVPYKRLTIHRHHPHDDLGAGVLGLLNFDRDRVIALVERGFNDAMNHDCAASHCILPGESALRDLRRPVTGKKGRGYAE